MRVTFYRNNSDERKVRKSLSTVTTVECMIKEPCTMLEPTIMIERSALSNFNGVNFFYIDTFNRYYNIVDDIAITGDFLTIKGKVEPLYSNLGSIMNLNCVVLRQEHKYNKLYQDTELPIRATKTYAYKMVGNLPNVMTYLLTVDGGK